MEEKIFLDYSTNEKLKEQDKKILTLIHQINIFMIWKDYKNIILNSLSLVWENTFKTWFTKQLSQKNVSDFPGLNFKTWYGKDIYNFKEAYNYINKFDDLWESSLTFLNNILNNTLETKYVRVAKEIKNKWKTLYKTISWKTLEKEFNKFIILVRTWLDWWYSSSFIAYLYYIFIHLHPFADANWRTSRVLIEYLFSKKMKLECPSVFFNFYLNNNKKRHYALCTKLNKKEKWAFEEFAEEFNIWVIKQLETSLDIFTKLEDFIVDKIEKVKKIWIDGEKIIREIYSNVYFEYKYPYLDNKVDKVLTFLLKNNSLEYYMHKWKLYYYDTDFVDILKDNY